MSAKVDSLYQDVMAFIAGARAITNDDTAPMDVLATDISALTTAIDALPLHERLTYRQKLDELAVALRELEEQLVEKKQAILSELESQPKQRKAHTAYQKTDKLEG